jgi:hypothetical protein
MIRTIFILFLPFLTLISNAQGSWNIGYIPVDSIDPEDINKEVKIDFRHTRRHFDEKINRSFRYFISSKDTGQIQLKEMSLDVVEVRKIYPDHGDYAEQYLECTNYENNRLLRVYDSEILEIARDSILFRLDVEIYDKRKNKIRGGPVLESRRCWIEKNKLDGVMTRI